MQKNKRKPAQATSRQGQKPTPKGKDMRHMRLYGTHAVAAAWCNPQRRLHHFYATENALAGFEEALATAEQQGLKRPPPQKRSADELARLLPDGAVHQGLVLEADPLPESDLSTLIPASGSCLFLLLDQVNDPQNIGAVLRSAAAFGCRALIMQDRHAPEISGLIAKIACGAVDYVPILHVTNLARSMEELKAHNIWCLGLSEHATQSLPQQQDLSDRLLLCLGAEGKGLRPNLLNHCDWVTKLPTQAPMESLNVSNAAAIALYEITCRRSG